MAISSISEIKQFLQDLGMDGSSTEIQRWWQTGLKGDALKSAMINSATPTSPAATTSTKTVANAEEIRRNYQMLFGRDPKEEGLEYWGKSGFTGDVLTQAIARGALGEDATSYSNRTAEYQNLYSTLFGKAPNEGDVLRWMGSGLTGDRLIKSMIEDAQGTYLPVAGGPEGFDLEAYTKAAQDYLGSKETIQGLMEGPGEFKESPGYQFRLREGEKAIERSAAARGNVLGGATAKALTRYGQDYATADYDNFLRRYYDSLKPWQSLAGVGQTSATTAAGQAANFGYNIGNSITNAGNVASQNALLAGQAIAGGAQSTGQAIASGAYQTGQAQASGAINQSNAITGALNSGINNYLMWKYMGN